MVTCGVPGNTGIGQLEQSNNRTRSLRSILNYVGDDTDKPPGPMWRNGMLQAEKKKKKKE